MGCLLCGRRQVDPGSGPSAWRRAVSGGEQVLVCPDCQVEGWTSRLDRCASCGSTALRKRLGVVECGACGHHGDAVPGPSATSTGGEPRARRELAHDVASAVDRVLGRGPGTPA